MTTDSRPWIASNGLFDFLPFLTTGNHSVVAGVGVIEGDEEANLGNNYASQTFRVSSGLAGASVAGDAEGAIAVSGLGTATGGLAVSALGAAHGGSGAASLTGEARIGPPEFPCLGPAASVLGNADGRQAAVSVVGDANACKVLPGPSGEPTTILHGTGHQRPRNGTWQSRRERHRRSQRRAPRGKRDRKQSGRSHRPQRLGRRRRHRGSKRAGPRRGLDAGGLGLRPRGGVRMKPSLTLLTIVLFVPAAAALQPPVAGFVCVDVEGPASCSLAAVSVLGESEGGFAAVSVLGDATCNVAVCAAGSGAGDAQGNLAAVSVAGDSTCNAAACAAVSGAGDARGSLSAVSLAGCATCNFLPCVAVAPLGHARGSAPLSILGCCNGIQCVAFESDGDAEAFWLAVSVEARLSSPSVCWGTPGHADSSHDPPRSYGQGATTPATAPSRLHMNPG